MTHQEIQALTPGQTLHDDVVTGLHVRARGRCKSFHVFYRTRAGTQRRPVIGRFPTLSLQDAREVAREILKRVALGEDPKGEWDKKKAELYVSQLWQKVWHEHYYCERFQRSGWADEAERLYNRELLPAFAHKKVSDVTVSDVREWHAKYKDKPYTGNRALEVLSKMMTFAEEREVLPPGANPCRLVSAHGEKKRRRHARESEIQAIALILEREVRTNPSAVAFIYTLMFTGARPLSIEKAKHTQLTPYLHNGETWGWLKFDGKGTSDSGEQEAVLLPPKIMQLIHSLPVPQDGTIFGRKMPRDFWNKVRQEAGCPDLWARDWRRTYSSIGLANGVSIDKLGELLNHRSTETTKGYTVLMEVSRINSAQTVVDGIQRLLTP